MWDIFYSAVRPLFQAPEQILKHVDDRAAVLDLGCGYGNLCAALAARNPARIVTGIDHDAHKIRVARTRYASRPNLLFEVNDLRQVSHTDQETVLLIDVLHYFDRTDQAALLRNLAANGRLRKLIVRDAVRAAHPGYLLTRIHEWLMTRAGRTRVGQTRFTFLTKPEWLRLADSLGMALVFERAGLPFYHDHLIILSRSP